MLDGLKTVFENVEKKYLYIGGGFFLLMFFALIVGSCNNNKGKINNNNLYEGIKELMVESAKEYYDYNTRLLPKEGERKEVTINSLVNRGFLDDLSEYLPSDVSCDGKVVLSNIEGEYKYVAFLDCGKAFSEIALYEILLDSNKVTESGPGLYEGENEKYFRGEVNNNYIKIGDGLWRILSVDADNNIKIVFDKYLDDRKGNIFERGFVWDNAYNSDTLERVGINNFEVSRIKNTLVDFSKEKEVVSKDVLAKVTKKNLCIGARAQDETLNNNSVECSLLSQETYYIGLLTASDYLRVSLDTNCTNTISPACMNYNFLTSYRGSFWTSTPSKENTYETYYIDITSIKKNDAISQYKVRPTLHLNDTVIKTDGDGTLNSPYEIK